MNFRESEKAISELCESEIAFVVAFEGDSTAVILVAIGFDDQEFYRQLAKPPEQRAIPISQIQPFLATLWFERRLLREVLGYVRGRPA